MAQLDDLKESLKIDGSDEDSVISGYLEAATQYVKGAVGDDNKFWNDEKVKPLFNIAVLSLAGAYYTYRIPIVDVQSYEIDLTLNSIIGQLRGMYALSESVNENA
ncbi:head-tail connector protein [Liquorilactobacillus capillatus]|uniref:DNA packaging protein n=1 Tax=Liquorilactobacillus capillatus DSM 19910 TaxID=1423731 RepID=A0A0R1M3C5_9LACO|nr:head-tail connector protein [Liquorilactobacillus capillatus]KRL02519.1 hypothetical protein FC81_GL000687 [Liquorilactobacillus capillatus DSM 19910]